MNLPSAIVLLITGTVSILITARIMVESLEGMVHDHPSFSKDWISLILIPVISNIAATAAIVPRMGNLELAMGAAVGSCVNITFLIIPFSVLAAWGIGKPLILLFHPLEIILLFFSVLISKFSMEDGRSHRLSGLALILVYVLISLSFWSLPDSALLVQGQPPVCPK
ncbi:hypothetical protein MD484_g8232, partial [Candolleomyces efflorescens]